MTITMTASPVLPLPKLEVLLAAPLPAPPPVAVATVGAEVGWKDGGSVGGVVITQNLV
jgi:hypothetical protein